MVGAVSSGGLSCLPPHYILLVLLLTTALYLYDPLCQSYVSSCACVILHIDHVLGTAGGLMRAVEAKKGLRRLHHANSEVISMHSHVESALLQFLR